MKFLFIIFTVFLSAHSFAKSCEDFFVKNCVDENLESRNEQLRALNITAFKEIAKSSAVEDLICKNFDRQNGDLVYDFLWNRSCWDWKYRRSYRRMGIETCEDFSKAGAPENFILNCQQLLNKKLVDTYYSSLHFKTKEMIKRVKDNFLHVLKDEPYHYQVERKFKQVIDMTHLEMNLSRFKAEFVRASEVCEKVNDYHFCSVYEKSDKLFLSLGAHAFYDQPDLELFLVTKFAEYIVDDVKYYESINLQQVYLELLTDLTHQWRIESLLARSVSSDIINNETIKAMLIKKYIEGMQKKSFFEEQESLSLLCPSNSQVRKDKSEYYYEYFYQLHPKDAMELMLCE